MTLINRSSWDSGFGESRLLVGAPGSYARAVQPNPFFWKRSLRSTILTLIVCPQLEDKRSTIYEDYLQKDKKFSKKAHFFQIRTPVFSELLCPNLLCHAMSTGNLTSEPAPEVLPCVKVTKNCIFVATTNERTHETNIFRNISLSANPLDYQMLHFLSKRYEANIIYLLKL